MDCQENKQIAEDITSEFSLKAQMTRIKLPYSENMWRSMSIMLGKVDREEDNNKDG